ECETGDENRRFRIVAVHVKDRRFDHLGDVGAVRGGTRVGRAAGGETDLVVDHDVYGTAGPETVCLGQLESFRDHALRGEGGIAMDQYREYFRPLEVAAALLPGPDAALDHRIHDLEVRG